jgi:hypothetical protein
MTNNARHARLIALTAILATGLLLSAGCVRRTVTINTKPEGARITLNDEVVGTSPVTKDFLWYGDYGVMAEKEGYAVVKSHKRLNAPWYQLPVVDLFTELLLPVEFHDRQTIDLELAPSTEVNRDELIQKAKQVRDEALYGSD